MPGIFYKKLKELNRKRVDFFRRLKIHFILYGYSWLFKYKHTCPKDWKKGIKSVGIIWFNAGIGDYIVLSGFIRDLFHNGYDVYWIGSQKTDPLIHEVLGEKIKTIIIQDPGHIWDIKPIGYCDILIDFNEDFHKVLLNTRALFKVKHKCAIGFNQPNQRFFDINIHRVEVNSHFTDRAKDISELLQLQNFNSASYSLSIKDTAYAATELFLAEHKIRKHQYVVINTSASDKRRSLSYDFVQQIISYLHRYKGLKLIVLNVTDSQLITSNPDVIFNPFTKLDEALALLRDCALLITPDTCFVHAANFFNCPSICFYNNRRLFCKYDNNTIYAPNYNNSLQVLAPGHNKSNSEGGDDLRNLELTEVLPFIKNRLSSLLESKN